MKKSIALLGPKGSFSDGFSSRFKMKKIFTKSFSEIFQKVISGKADFGFVPIENTGQGSLSEPAALIRKFRKKISILKKIKCRIRLSLAAKKKIPLQKIEILYAAPYIIPQCTNFLNKNLLCASIKAAKSSSDSLKKAGCAKNSAAIGSARGIKIYGLKILAENIQNSKNNFTTFILFSKSPNRTK